MNLRWLPCVVWLAACSEVPDSAARDAGRDAASAYVPFRDAGRFPPPADAGPRECHFPSACPWPEACVRGICARSTTCDGAELTADPACFDWDDLTSLAGVVREDLWMTYGSIHLVTDGGVSALGTEDDFRCPEVSELWVSTGGESTGKQPICGPNRHLGPAADAGADGPLCCYGVIQVAGP